MPRLLEADAEFLTLNYDTLAPDKQAEAKDWLQRYKQQQADEGEPLFPSVVTRQVEQENNLRRMFEAPDKIDYDPGYTSADPLHDKMQHANMALLSARYQKEPAEVASRYAFLLNDYARQKFGASEDVDTAKFYALAQKDMQKVKLREDTQREGMSAALRGEDGVKALAAWQAKNADRAKDDAGLFMRGYQQAIEQDGEMLPIADRLLPLLEAGASKREGQVFDQTKAQELGGMIEQLAGMKKAQRKSVYRAIAARIEAAGYDQKGFWSQMLGFLDQQLYAAGSSLRETGGIAADVSTAVAGAQTRIPDTFDGSSVSLPVLSDEEQQALLRQRDYRERIGDVEGEIMQIVSGELDPVRPTTGWMNETIETGLIKAPGAILPSMGASALLGPYGAGLLFTADFAANNRRELVQSGLDADQARKVAVMAAPLQAAVESLSNMVSLGKFPAVQAALSRFTRPVGGASLVGRYVQNSLISGATEFTEEQVQGNLVVPVMQKVLGVFETYMPEVDWDFYKTRAANATPELAATLFPMALVFGGVMTAADAKLSRTMTQNVDLMMATGMDQAQAVEIASQPTQEQRIRKGAELWSQRKGTKASMEEAQKKLADQYRTLAADSAAAVKELEARGVLPRLLPMQGGEYRLTFNDGSTADFKTREEALGGIHVYIRDRMQRSTRALRETIDTLTKNLEQGREFALEISPEAMPADEAVKRGIISPQALQERAAQGAILDATTLIENSVLTGKALGDEEAPLMLFGMSKNEWYDKEGRAIGMQRIKDDILRTTMRLWDGASPLTLIEEKTEGDAKVILSTPGKHQWMLDHLRAYEDASGDKLFTSDDNAQINDKQLIEAWSHMAQSYFVAAKDKVKGRTLGRYLRDIEEAELTAAMQGRASWWQAVVNRAQKLGELKAAGKLGADVVAELEKQLGIDSQVKHEQGAMQEAQQVRDEVAQQVDTSGYSEANPGPNGETFSASRAIPADASKVVQMPDGARLVGPTTFSIAEYAGNHRPNNEGPRAFDLLEGGISPADVYQHPEWYSAMEPKVIRETMAQLRKVKGNPKAKLTIYRAGPKGEMNTGDWVSLSKEYARTHAESQDPEGFRVWQAQVAADSVRWSLDDLAEFGYFGEQVAASDTGETFSIRAYHGTPHKVDKFRLDKIGTGEGAQAYGWGLYFAQSQTVAKSYADTINPISGINKNAATAARNTARSVGGRAKAIAWFENMLAQNADAGDAYRAETQAKIDWLRSATDADISGNLYTVELLPDADEFLDWDKPLSEQSEKVKATLKEVQAKPATADGLDMGGGSVIRDNRRGQFDKSKPYPWLLVSGKSVFGLSQADVDRMTKEQADATGENIYTRLTALKGSQKAASEYLASLGIPGIRYLDGGSRGAGDGTRNYVIFDENLVRILEENGKPVAQETFSLRVTPAQDAEYMAAVEAGDMEKAQRMVDAVAKAAGFNVGPVYHAGKVIDRFDKSKIGTGRGDTNLGRGFYFHEDKDVVEGVYGEEGPVKAFYIKAQNPLDVQSTGGNNRFEQREKDGYDSARRVVFDKNEDTGQVDIVPLGEWVVWNPNQAKSADPVTRDESGNVIPLSQRFNPADDRITYSLRPGDFASRVEAMFSPFQRSPEARLVMARVAKDRALRLGNELIEKANVIRTMGSIDREARVRAALAEDKAVQDYLDGLTSVARQTLEWQPADLQDDPLIAAMLDFGKLMSKTTALQRGKVDLKMGDFDGAPWLPPSFYSKGAGIMPDQMAQAMFDAGLLPDAYTDTLWAELSKRIEATRKDKTAHREAVQAFKDAKKAARDAASKEAGTWADNAKKQAGSNKAQRDRIKAWLRVLDGILAASPPDVRARVGGFTKMAGIATDEAALRYLEDRVAKLDKELEKYLVKQARGQLERIFDKARPKSDAGEKAKGKLTPELHAWFKLAEEAAKLSPAVADERIQGIEQSLASDMTDAIKQELSDWLGRPVTDDAEAQTWQETRLTLFQTFGAVMYGTDAKSERNAAEITAALDAAREAYQTGRLAHIEQLAKLREKRAEERGDGIQRVGSPYDPNKANTRKKALNKATGLKGRALDYMDTGLDASGFFLDLLGDDTTTDLYETTRRNLLEAAATKTDNMEKRKADFAAMLKQVFPGKGLVDRLRGLWELQQIQENAPVGTMSQLQAMQFTLWHLDPDSREWLATNGYGDEWQAKAEQWLTTEAKAVRAWLLKQYDGQYDRLNPVFRRLRGVNLPRVEVYGGKRQIEHSKSDSTASIEADMMRGGMDAGFTKTRVSRPTGRPRMTDALQNYWQNALQVEHYIAFAETVTELKAVFGHRDFLGAVETNRGLAKKQQVLDWISNIETAGTRDAFAHSMQGKLFGRYGKAVSASALLFKVATLAKQAPAAIQSAFKVGLKEYFTSLSRILAGKGAISLGDMYRSDTVQRRLSGHDSEMLQASKGWNQRHFENEILDKAAIAPEVMMNAGWYAMGWTDARFTTISAAVAYDVAFRDGKKLGMSDDEAKAFAANQADLIVMETAQPQDVVTKSLSENMMPQALLRLVFAFQSANRQVFGLTYLAAKQGKVANAYAVAALIAGLTQTIGGIMRMMFSDDDPEELFDPKAYLYGMTTAPLTGMVGLGPLVEIVLNFAGVESRYAPSSAAAVKSLQDIVNGEADTKDVGRVVSMAGAALGGRGAMLGVGWNVLNQMLGLYENVTD